MKSQSGERVLRGVEFSSRELPPLTYSSSFNEEETDSPEQVKGRCAFASASGVMAKLGPVARSGGGNGAFIYGTLIQCPSASGSFNWIFFLLVLVMP